MEVGEGLGALDRKSALYVSVYTSLTGVPALIDCGSAISKMSGVGISRNLSVVLRIVQRQVYDCNTAVKRQRKYAWPVQRETGSPHARWVEITPNSNLPSLMTLKIKNRLVGWGLIRHISMLSVRWWSGDGSELRN